MVGNRAEPRGDYLFMRCDDIRVALSARLDGEDPRVPATRLDEHLGGCPACRGWLHRAEQVADEVRARSAPAPDLTATVLAAVVADGSLAAARQAAAVRGRRQVLRVAVAVAAVAQLLLAAQALFGGMDLPGGFALGADPHTSREMASFDIALAVGFALAAYRPERARAIMPIALVLAICLTVTTAFDVANSSTALVHEIGHLATIAQAALLWALGRTSPAPGTPATLTSAVA